MGCRATHTCVWRGTPLTIGSDPPTPPLPVSASAPAHKTYVFDEGEDHQDKVAKLVGDHERCSSNVLCKVGPVNREHLDRLVDESVARILQLGRQAPLHRCGRTGGAGHTTVRCFVSQATLRASELRRPPSSGPPSSLFSPAPSSSVRPLASPVRLSSPRPSAFPRPARPKSALRSLPHQRTHLGEQVGHRRCGR